MRSSAEIFSIVSVEILGLPHLKVSCLRECYCYVNISVIRIDYFKTNLISVVSPNDVNFIQ